MIDVITPGVTAANPGYFIELSDGGPWLSQDGMITEHWEQRGIWPTEQEADAALMAWLHRVTSDTREGGR